MEIEIVTTKKKLTKSLIEQIPHIKMAELEEATVLGHVLLDQSVILLELGRFEYRKIYWGWMAHGVTHVWRRVGKYTSSWDLKSEAERDLFLSKLEEFKSESIQIYI